MQNYKSKGWARSPKEIFNAQSFLENIIERCFRVLKAHFHFLKRMGPYTQVPIVVAAVTLRNYIRHEAQRDWLLEKDGNDELVVRDSYDEDEEEETLTRFMPSHLTSEMDSF